MNRDPRLERYLSTLESALKPFPVSDRADIITEIKSHVLAALERDPNASVDSILAALGEPEIVANRYLLERGLKPAKPPISPIVRWIIIGFLGSFAMLLLFVAFIVAQFSPIVKVSEKDDKVEILGGMVHLDGKKNRITINGISNFTAGNVSSGTQTVKPGHVIDVKFTNGHVEAEGTDTSTLEWECKGAGTSLPTPTSDDTVTNIDFTGLSGAHCDLKVPKSVKLKVLGTTGHIAIANADFDVDAQLTRGHIDFAAADEIAFKYDVKVDMGKADKFESSTNTDARIAHLHVGSGRISSGNAE